MVTAPFVPRWCAAKAKGEASEPSFSSRCKLLKVRPTLFCQHEDATREVCTSENHNCAVLWILTSTSTVTWRAWAYIQSWPSQPCQREHVEHATKFLTWGCSNVCFILLIGPNGTLLPGQKMWSLERLHELSHPSPVNFFSQWSLSLCVSISVIIRISSVLFSTRALFVANLGSVASAGFSSTFSARMLNFRKLVWSLDGYQGDEFMHTCLLLPAPIINNPSLQGKTWYGTIDGWAVPCREASCPAIR
jgi:hypothetical protein